MDQSVFAAAVHGCVVLKLLARIGEIPFVVLLHQAEVLHHGILDSAALEHCHVHVVGVLEQAASAAGQRGHSAQCAELRGQLRAQAKSSAAGATASPLPCSARQKQRDNDGQDRKSRRDPEDGALALGKHNQKIEQRDFIFFPCRVGWRRERRKQARPAHSDSETGISVDIGSCREIKLERELICILQEAQPATLNE